MSVTSIGDIIVAMLPLLLACAQAKLSVDGADTGKDDPILGDSADTADSADTGETDELVYDCAALPQLGDIEDNELVGPRAYHDVIFDDAGNLLGTDGSSILKSTYAGAVTPFVPGLGTVQGMAHLPDGDIVAADDTQAALLRIGADGAVSTIATGLSGAYGVTVGPDGMVYVGNIYNGGRVEMVRVDPTTGESATWLTMRAGESPRMVVFSVDNTVGYIATVGRMRVYAVDLDADLNVVGDARVYADNVGAGWQDGIGLDACGNLYVPDYSSSSMYRITPDGTVEDLMRHRAGIYGHGLEWGSGIGGWRTDAIYLPQPYDGLTVRELVIGVPSADTLRTGP